jgi:hypothetical protein
MRWRSATTWASVGGPGAQFKSKRSQQAAANTILSSLPPHLEISNVKLSNSPLNLDKNGRKLLRRDAEEYNVFYNGSLPLTFMLHHPVATSRKALGKSEVSESDQHIPLFIATDGSKLYLTHIEDLNSTSSDLPLNSRSGYNGYDKVGMGGLKIESNSDPVTTWDQVLNWLEAPTEGGNYLKPYDSFLAGGNYGMFVGHSFVQDAHNMNTGWMYNGQWAMEGETNVSSI